MRLSSRVGRRSFCAFGALAGGGTLAAALLCAAGLAATHGGPPGTGAGAETRPATRPAPAAPESDSFTTFQPGVAINWAEGAVKADATVVLRSGPLEFLACFPGKEHESVVRFDAPATVIYMALGLAGMTPGHPPRWDDEAYEFGPPSGALVDVFVRWSERGSLRVAHGFEWLREIEYARVPIPRPWVFSGSVRLPNGTLAADRSGVGVALVDFSDSLFSLTRRYPSQYGALWAEANTAAIPELKTRVEVIFRPARPVDWHVDVDFRGAAFVRTPAAKPRAAGAGARGAFVTPSDLADLLRIKHELAPATVQVLHVHATPVSDREHLRRVLVGQGVPQAMLRFVEAAAP